MATFNNTYGPDAMLASVAQAITRDVESNPDMDVHTITLVLNGQHGEFDLSVEATDADMEDHTWVGIAYRSGGVADFRKVGER